MAQIYREGLNYVPLLSHNSSPPCSSRSRISLNKNRSHRSLVYYNGNYEGDSSMFKDKRLELDRLSLVDTESDTELQNDTSRSIPKLEEKGNNNRTVLATRLLQFALIYVKPEWSEQIKNALEKFQYTDVYKNLEKIINFITVLWTYIFYIAKYLCNQLLCLGHILWKRRMIFRNLARRLLWWLTLAKCDDLSLFLLILICLPILFILSLFGLIIAICGKLKDVLHQSGYFMKKI